MQILNSHICKICDKIYKTKHSLSNHNRIYHNIKNNPINILSFINLKYEPTNQIMCIFFIIFFMYIFALPKTKNCKKNNPVNILSFCNPKYEPINQLICRYYYKNFSFRQNKHMPEKICNKNNKEENIIVKSDDNNFLFDIINKKLIFYDNTIKYIFYNEQIYFKGDDITTMLGYNDTEQAIQINVNIEDIQKGSELLENKDTEQTILINVDIENEEPQTVFINESGFYSIILASKKPKAIEFKKWVTSIVFPSIRKTNSYNLIDNYIEEDLEKYYNKDCVYIIHIEDNIYKYGYTSHILKRLQAHKTNLNYNKIIKIYDMDNINEAIKLEGNIKKLIKSLNINIVYNNQIEIFKVENNNLQNIIKKIDEFSLKTINKNSIKENIIIEKEKTKQLELENNNLKLKLELFKLSK